MKVESVTDIDWKRTPEPQADQYDTDVAERLAKGRGPDVSGLENAPRIFDGAVPIEETTAESVQFPESCVPAPADHPNIQQAVELIRLWPTVFTQCQRLIRKANFFVDTAVPEKGFIGSLSRAGADGFGTVAVTVNDPVALAESIVHEMGHNKLRALGVDFTSAKRIVTNTEGDQYKSPVRYDCLRPMTAILHAMWSYTYLTALDVEILRASSDHAVKHRVAQQSLALNLPRLDFGLDVLQSHVQTDEAGKQFFFGFFQWLDRVRAAGYDILERVGIKPLPFVHPDDAQGKTNGPRPARVNGLHQYRLGEETLIYVPDAEKAHALNPSAVAIFDLCDGSRTVQDICRELGPLVGKTAGELTPDVEQGVTQLRELGLLQPD